MTLACLCGLPPLDLSCSPLLWSWWIILFASSTREVKNSSFLSSEYICWYKTKAFTAANINILNRSCFIHTGTSWGHNLHNLHLPCKAGEILLVLHGICRWAIFSVLSQLALTFLWSTSFALDKVLGQVVLLWVGFCWRLLQVLQACNWHECVLPSTYSSRLWNVETNIFQVVCLEAEFPVAS